MQSGNMTWISSVGTVYGSAAYDTDPKPDAEMSTYGRLCLWTVHISAASHIPSIALARLLGKVLVVGLLLARRGLLRVFSCLPRHNCFPASIGASSHHLANCRPLILGILVRSSRPTTVPCLVFVGSFNETIRGAPRSGADTKREKKHTMLQKDVPAAQVSNERSLWTISQ